MVRALVLLLPLAGTVAAAAPPVDYLYVDANEGSSAGGHTAIRFGAETFHFQHHPGGALRIHRDDSQRFLHDYSRLQNRTVRATHIRVSDDTYALLRDTFLRHTLAQDSQFELHADLRRNIEVLDALAGQPIGRDAPPGAVPVRGAGLFDTAGTHHSAVLVALRERVAADHGPAALSTARRAVDEAIARLVPAVTLPGDLPAPEIVPAAPPTFAATYLDLLATRVALTILATAPPLRSGVVRDVAAPALRLDHSQSEALRVFAGRLTAELAALVTSQRPDRGFALLLGMARLEALARSVSSSRLVVLDAFSPAAPAFRADDLARREDVLAELLAEAGEQLSAQRAQLAAPLDEAGYANLEAAANRWLELHRAAHEHADLRVQSGRLLPAHPGWVGDLPRPALDPAALPATREHAAEVADQYGTRLVAAYRYNLLTNNCVSAIFATIDRALAGAGAGEEVGIASARLLGGHLRMAGTANFIPFVSAAAVAATYRVDGTTVTLPYRRLRIDEMLAREPAWLVHLRESNRLTSTLHPGGDDDSAFLFFTDGAPWLRPLFGAANLVAGTLTAAAGLLTAPFDAGKRLRAGLHGVVFSAPELAFLNLRKGTFPHVPRAYRVGFPSRPTL
ncbi:hypothetical protein L6Q96_00325 [Candidatus Binatia bacterium]|nr:hypothetical protein [Candidatus Binatia bacterium]